MVRQYLSAAVSLLALSSASPITPIKRGLSFDYSKSKVRGVNTGGWFVLEPWITPSIFEGNSAKDEWTFTEMLGKDAAKSKLQQHWNSWITQDDFNQMAKAGLNHVRIPIGYWSVLPRDNEPYVQGAYDKLGEALDWASGAGLKVMIDLHGAPESQNGFDNSGKYGNVGWGQGDSVSYTKKVLNKIRDDHASHPAVNSIQLLNEPGPNLDINTVKQFYMDGWGNLKDSNVAITIHDAFKGVTGWNSFGAGMPNLVLDTHHYEIFVNEQLGMDLNSHIKMACDFGNQMASTGKPTIAGEWTGGITDCAKWLNGKDKGARYDGTFGGASKVGDCWGKSTGSVRDLSNADKNNVGRFIEAQLDAFEKAAGWIFWTWKTEGAPEWDMQDLLANGLFPQPLDSRKYPGQCK